MIAVSRVRLRPGSWRDLSAGLLGYLAFVLDEAVEVDGITLRRTCDGSLVLSYPVRRDGRGDRHAILRPLNDEVRRTIEAEVLAQLGPWSDGGPQ